MKKLFNLIFDIKNLFVNYIIYHRLNLSKKDDFRI